MCKSCDGFTWNTVQYLGHVTSAYGDYVSTSLFAAAADPQKGADAFPADGVGDVKDLDLAAPGTGLIVTPDEAGDGIGDAPGNPTITVGAPSQVATINTIGDQDFFQVTLEAGKTYEIGQYAKAGGPNATPLADAYIELYDATGKLIVIADGGGPNTPSGLDALLSFTPTEGGTYYVNFRAYDNAPEDGDNGDVVGDYEYFVREADGTAYRPYYDVDSPLYALDWGSQVDGTVRNPDGNEGTRTTGNTVGTPDSKGATIGHWGQSTEGKNVIKIYFAKQGDVYGPEDPASPGLPPAIVAVGAKPFEIEAVWISLREFEKVADIVYVETQNRAEADFHYVTYSGTPGPGVSLLGSMSPPGEPDEGLAQFNSGDYRWNATNLQQGGFSFVTLIHEFGHGHGMSHPHDGGGRSGVMRGVEEEGVAFDYTTGDFDLNQGVFTMMSYEDGWQKSPYGNAKTDVGYGYLGGLMAFDIAVIQDKYGVNEDWATGDDVYEMKDVNAAGTYYSSIWDGGGVDEIRYTGAKNTTIDLRQATLKYEVGGGGFMSYAHGIFGGYTIANGVTIENATSGDGNDNLIGNAANNVLKSGAGNDVIRIHLGGNDTVDAGDGVDTIYAGAAFDAGDTIDGGPNRDALILQGNYAGVTFGTGTTSNITGIDSISLLAGDNTTFGDTAGNSYSYNLTMLDSNVAQGAVMKVNGFFLRAGENFTFNGAAETDGSFQVLGGHGVDTLTGGSQSDVFVFGHDGRFGAGDTVNGGAGYDVVYLRGDYNVDFDAAGFAGSLTGVESVGLLTSANNEFAGGGDGEFDYSITASDAMLAAGGTMTFNGSRLGAAESFTFDGSRETDGNFKVWGGAGADSLTGGAGNDLIYGGGGADQLRGNAGGDTFRYQSASDSTSTATDMILDFLSGTDRIDLSRIDAIAGTTETNEAFSFIGGGAFTNVAGQLRATNVSGNVWRVEGDVNGDGTADLVIDVTLASNQPLVATDFQF
jgi:Ca2+-binding RTX toxin-like protein